MPSRANDLVVIPDSFWERPETIAALRKREMGRFFALIQQYTGASQTRIGMACGGLTQGKISDIMRGVGEIKHLTLFEQIADGLKMPDSARTALGLTPRTAAPAPAARKSRAGIPPGDATPALPSPLASDGLNLDEGDGQEDDDPVRRRTFVGLTSAAMLSAIFTDPAPDALLKAEPLAPALAGHTAGGPLDQARTSGCWRPPSTTRAASIRNAATRT